MKESEAWMLLAEHVDRIRQWTDYSVFICSEACELVPNFAEAIRKRISLDFERHQDVAWEHDEDYDKALQNKARVLACMMFSHEAKSEGR